MGQRGQGEWSTNQCSDGEACSDAGNGSCANIACDAANGREGAEGIGDVFGNLGMYVLDMLVPLNGGARGQSGEGCGCLQKRI